MSSPPPTPNDSIGPAPPGCFGVMYNACFGGYSFSDAFCKEYKKRLGEPAAEDDDSDDEYMIRRRMQRTDPVAIQLLQEKGSDWSSNHPVSQIRVAWLPDLFREYYRIDAYDGLENVLVDYGKIYRDVLRKHLALPDPDPRIVAVWEEIERARASIAQK